MDKNAASFILCKINALALINICTYLCIYFNPGGSLRVAMSKSLECVFKLSDFDLPTHYCVLFRTNTLSKRKSPVKKINCISAFFLQG